VVVLVGPDQLVRWVSPSVTRTLGWAPADLVGTLPSDLMHPADRARLDAARDAVFSGREVITPAGGFVARMRTNSGGYRWISLMATPVTDASGAFLGVVAGWRDVDDLVHAQQAAQSDREHLRATLDSLLDPHVLFEAVRDERGQIVDFRFADANPAACAYDGIAYQDLVGSRLLEHYPGVVGAGLLKQYTHVVETGEPLRLDDVLYPMETMGGQDRYLDISAARVGDGLSYTWRDVTERHEAAEYASRMAAVVEQSHDAIIGVSFPDTLVTSWNPAAERMYGYTAEEIIGKTAFILTPKDQLEQAKELMPQLSVGEPVEDFETVRIRKDGSQIQVSMSSSPIRDANGVTVGLSTIHRDITKEKAAREYANRLAAVVEYSGDAIVGGTPEGIITSWNPAAERMYG
jgi:PAS domain S-box-containing protein